MFTGIIEEVGTLVAIERGETSATLTIAGERVSEGVRLGDSIAVNGTCLTVVGIAGTHLRFDAVPETIQRTSLKIVRVGDAVNLERSLAVGDRLGGHFVQGHVDGTGILREIRDAENAHVLTVQLAPEMLRYLAPKGSVALDGISLTVVDVLPDAFTVWIIPHTYTQTNLRYRAVGDPLNIETDMLAKYMERLLAGRTDAASAAHLG